MTERRHYSPYLWWAYITVMIVTYGHAYNRFAHITDIPGAALFAGFATIGWPFYWSTVIWSHLTC